jgi:hypothetical protein
MSMSMSVVVVMVLVGFVRKSRWERVQDCD